MAVSRQRLVIIACMLLSTNALATLRCGTAVVDEGDLTTDVLRKCGEPASREVSHPPEHANGRPRAAPTVERWVYGPKGGMYQNLRFVDGRLVEIRSRYR